MGSLNDLYAKHKDQAAFYLVYIREAHPDDGWKAPQNERQGIHVLDPKTFEERQEVAHTCSEKLDIRFPVIVDTMDNAAEHAYAAWPDRLYIVGADGKIAYKGDVGPAGFKAQEMGRALEKVLAPNVGR